MSVAAERFPPSRSSLERRASIALWAVFSAACCLYAVAAFDYFISFAAGRDGLWLRFMARLVSHDYAYGAGSVHVDQERVYAEALRFLVMHTTMGAIALALGPFQFIAAIRRRVPALHRTMGRIYLTTVVLSMFAGIGYLSMTPLARIYSGAPFGIALWGLDFMVLFTAWRAYSAIRQRDVFRHQAWMAFNFGLVLSTPGLRFFWVVFGWTFPQLSQAETNLGTTTFLLPLVIMTGLVWLAIQRRPQRSP